MLFRSSWLAVGPDGRVTAFFGKIDQGQGVDVAVAQVVAEELDVALAKVVVVMGDTATSVNQGGASNSTGVRLGAQQLRMAAAEARAVLLDAAAKKLGVAVEGLSVADGVVTAGGTPARTVTYAELIGGRYFDRPIEWNRKLGNALELKSRAKPKAVADYAVVGTSAPRAFMASMTAWAWPTRSASARLLPIFRPAASMKVLAMPPPTMSWSTLWAKLCKMVSLVDTFEPATMAANGRLGLASALLMASISAASSGPAQAMGANCAMP